MQGPVGMGEYNMESKQQPLAQVISGNAGIARAMLGLDSSLLKSEPVENSAIEAKRFADRAILLDHSARNDRKIAVRRVIVGLRQQFKELVKDTGREAIDCRFWASCPRDENYVIALLRLGVELRNDLGTILQVAIHDDDPIAVAHVKARGDGEVLAEIAGE